MSRTEFTVGFGGAAGDGQASVGDTLARISARLGLHMFIYNSYQSVIRGGHVWLRLRIADRKIENQGDRLDAVVALNQDCVEQHIGEIAEGGYLLFNAERVRVDPTRMPKRGIALGFPVRSILDPLGPSEPVMQNTVLLGGLLRILGIPFSALESALLAIFKHKGESVIKMNLGAARGGFEHAEKALGAGHRGVGFKPDGKRRAVVTGNECVAMGAVAAGCKFYSAYPMTPASGILTWFNQHYTRYGVVVKQCEDEIAVVNMAIGAGFAGARSMCATSGGGFALMTEAIGEAAMLEVPVVIVEVQRGGPSTGIPTKTEQADLNQVYGASQGDFPRVIIAPANVVDCFKTAVEALNLAERYQMPILVMSDLLLGEHRETADPDDFDFEVKIDRGAVVAADGANGANGTGNDEYKRYRFTPSGVSPRSLPGTPGHMYVATTDEHNEKGIIISDVYTHPPTRKKMMEKRMRKLEGVLKELPAPRLEGPSDAPVTLVGWGSSHGVIAEAIQKLAAKGVVANHLQIKYLLPFHEKEVTGILRRCKKTLVVELNYTAQFARFLRAETSHKATGNILKYDGEPFDPKHIVEGVEAFLAQGGPEGFRYAAATPHAFAEAFHE